MKEEFCIMPENNIYSTKRFYGSERHEVFEGRTGKKSIHLAPKEWIWLKELAEKTWCEYYGKTKEEFRERYGRNYL